MQSTEALLAVLGQLKASSPNTAVRAQVVQAQPNARGQFNVTLEVQGQRFTLTAPAPPTVSPLAIYRAGGQIRVGLEQGRSAAGQIKTPGELHSALPQLPSNAANVVQAALQQPQFQGWAAVFAQMTQPETLKRWIQSGSHQTALLTMAESLEEPIKERFLQVNDQRALANHEEQRQGLHSLRFDVPLPIGERWINGEATLKRDAKERDCWSFELLFDLPTAGRLLVHADIRPNRVALSIKADKPRTQTQLVQWMPGLEQRLRQAGLTIGGIEVKPWTQPVDRPSGRLDLHV